MNFKSTTNKKRLLDLNPPFFSWGQILGLRFADRFGKGMRGAPRDAFLTDVTSEEDRGKGLNFDAPWIH